MALFENKKIKQKKYFKEHHFLFVEKLFNEIAGDVLKWGRSSWWPKDGDLQYIVEEGEMEAGKGCTFVLKGKFLKAVFKGEIVQIRANRVLQLTWHSGMMTGQEFVLVEERSNGTRIDHRARYAGSNILNHLLWHLFFQKKYDESIQKALVVLKQSILSEDDSAIDA